MTVWLWFIQKWPAENAIGTTLPRAFNPCCPLQFELIGAICAVICVPVLMQKHLFIKRAAFWCKTGWKLNFSSLSAYFFLCFCWKLIFLIKTNTLVSPHFLKFSRQKSISDKCKIILQEFYWKYEMRPQTSQFTQIIYPKKHQIWINSDILIHLHNDGNENHQVCRGHQSKRCFVDQIQYEFYTIARFNNVCIARSSSLGHNGVMSLPFRYRVIIVIAGIVTAQKDTTTTLRIVAVQNKFLITNPKNGWIN